MKLKDLLKEAKEMTEGQIKEAMAMSGKITIPQLMSYMKSRYTGKYDLNLAKICAKEIKDSI